MATNDPLYEEAVARLRALFDEARSRGLDEPYAASLATADRSGHPSVRTITIAAIEDAGPLFFIDARSGKGRQIADNPRAALCFFWPGLHYQVIVEGDAAPVDDETADRHWGRRPRDSQIAAWASELDAAATPTGTTDASVAAARQQFAWDSAPCPPNWQGIRVSPTSFSFWKMGWRRLDARERYSRDEAGTWRKARIRPFT